MKFIKNLITKIVKQVVGDMLEENKKMLTENKKLIEENKKLIEELKETREELEEIKEDIGYIKNDIEDYDYVKDKINRLQINLEFLEEDVKQLEEERGE